MQGIPWECFKLMLNGSFELDAEQLLFSYAVGQHTTIRIASTHGLHGGMDTPQDMKSAMNVTEPVDWSDSNKPMSFGISTSTSCTSSSAITATTNTVCTPDIPTRSSLQSSSILRTEVGGPKSPAVTKEQTVGLRNHGNTCYINATLQLLYGCAIFLWEQGIND